MSVSLGHLNTTPSRDGDITPFVSKTAARCQDQRNRRLIFVNGMNNTAMDHRESAEAISTLIAGRVIAVYNQKGESLGLTLADYVKRLRDSIQPSNDYVDTSKIAWSDNWMKWGGNAVDMLAGGLHNLRVNVFNKVAVPFNKFMLDALVTALKVPGSAVSFVRDVSQCAEDFANIWAIMMAESPVRLVAGQFPEATKAFILWWFSYNPAIVSLARYLDENTYRGEQWVILAHSQGNLITSSALYALRCINSPACSRLKRVFAVATPAPSWPPVCPISTYRHSFDPVTWLGAVNPENVGTLAQLAGAVSLDPKLIGAGSILRDLSSQQAQLDENITRIGGHNLTKTGGYLSDQNLLDDLRGEMGLARLQC